MADEIDISDRNALQGGGFTDPRRVLCLIMAQAVADSSSSVALVQSHEDTTLRYETGGHWYDMVAPKPDIFEPLVSLLKEKAGIPADTRWGIGDILFRTEDGPILFRVDVCSDQQDHSLILLSREDRSGPDAGPAVHP